MRRLATRACGLAVQAAWRRPPSALAVRLAHSQWVEGDGTSGASAELAASPALPFSVGSAVEGEAHGFGPVTAMVSMLDGVHAATGLPWWMSIAASTLCVRAALVPLSVVQARAGLGLSTALASARAQGVDAAAPAKLAAFLRAHRRRHAGVPHPAWVLVAPLVQLPVFVSAMLAIRRAALLPLDGMAAGGTAWFTDLTQAAVHWEALSAPAGPLGAVLPATAVGLMLLNIQTAFGPAGSRPRMLGHYKLFLEWLMVPSLAAGLTLPQAVFCYWIPSNAWTLAQGAVLRRLYAAPQAQVAPVQQSAAAVAGSAGAESDAAVVDAPIVDDAPAPSQADALLPPQVAALLSAAAAARAAGKLEHAAGLLAQAQALAPQHARIAFAAAQVASLRGDWKAAARQYGDAVRLEGDRRQRGRARFGLGVAHVMLARAQGCQDSPQAEEAFRQAAEDRPGDGRPFLALASLLRAAGRHEDARQAAAQAAALEPTGKGGEAA